MVINELRQITIASTAKGLVTFQQNDSPLNDLPEQIADQGKLQNGRESGNIKNFFNSGLKVCKQK